ncbi:MFS transporter [Allofranklinella schreckenbergeri]|uniref:MFS transporter n=1 Tax=Allofranklinella schreckenbergeri TaxID=1076744 RepID=A0A3M6Q5T4_9BURK|nr:MFS transporter [Allofranklinella schreckenbergeri]RMW98549.1 MFS transporter [Allofranklinella schreckenbergeri]
MHTRQTHTPSRHWWPQQGLIGWLNLALTAPTVYLFIGLPLVLRQHGWSGTEIGLLQLAGLPAMLKFALAAPIDRWPLRSGRAAVRGGADRSDADRHGALNYRNWALALGLAYAAALMALALHPLHNTAPQTLFALLMLASLLGTWADVPSNALAIRILPASEHTRAGAIRSAATSLGAIAGGGLMLVMHARLGWFWPFAALAAAVLVGILALLLLPLHTSATTAAIPPPPQGAGQPPAAAHQKARLTDVPANVLAYFQPKPRRAWALLLLCYFPAVGAGWVYLKPLLLDQGFAEEHIAWGVGVAGGLLSALASLASARLTHKLGVRRTLPLFAGFNLLAMAALGTAVASGLGKPALLAAATALAMAMGASAALLFGLMMRHTRTPLQALDYGIQSSLFISARSLAPLLAGLLLDRLGHGAMLGALTVWLALVCALSWRLRDAVAASPSAQQD